VQTGNFETGETINHPTFRHTGKVLIDLKGNEMPSMKTKVFTFADVTIT